MCLCFHTSLDAAESLTNLFMSADCCHGRLKIVIGININIGSDNSLHFYER